MKWMKNNEKCSSTPSLNWPPPALELTSSRSQGQQRRRSQGLRQVQRDDGHLLQHLRHHRPLHLRQQLQHGGVSEEAPEEDQEPGRFERGEGWTGEVSIIFLFFFCFVLFIFFLFFILCSFVVFFFLNGRGYFFFLLRFILFFFSFIFFVLLLFSFLNGRG